jgi:hypothetical protein
MNAAALSALQAMLHLKRIAATSALHNQPDTLPRPHAAAVESRTHKRFAVHIHDIGRAHSSFTLHRAL